MLNIAATRTHCSSCKKEHADIPLNSKTTRNKQIQLLKHARVYTEDGNSFCLSCALSSRSVTSYDPQETSYLQLANNLTVPEILIKFGTLVNFDDADKINFFVSIMKSDKLIKQDIIKYILDNWIDFKSTSKNGFNFLHAAVKFKRLDIIEELINRGIDINSASNKGFTALHLSAKSQNLAITKFLIAQGADINCKNSNGLSPLHFAIWYKRVDIVALLIKHGANTKDIFYYKDKTFDALSLAYQVENEAIIDLLVKDRSENLSTQDPIKDEDMLGSTKDTSFKETTVLDSNKRSITNNALENNHKAKKPKLTADFHKV